MNETHLIGNTNIVVPSYRPTWIGFNRPAIRLNAPKGLGGVGILIKDTLLEEYSVNIIDKTLDGQLAIECKSKIIYLLVIYHLRTHHGETLQTFLLI